MVIKYFKYHEGRIYVSVGSLILVGFCTYPHLNTAAQDDEETMIWFLVILVLILNNFFLPVCEGIVDNSLQKQSISYLRRSSEREHVNSPQCWMSLAQTAVIRIKPKKNRMKALCLDVNIQTALNRVRLSCSFYKNKIEQQKFWGEIFGCINNNK